jgi:hypothetical protein
MEMKKNRKLNEVWAKPYLHQKHAWIKQISSLANPFWSCFEKLLQVFSCPFQLSKNIDESLLTSHTKMRNQAKEKLNTCHILYKTFPRTNHPIYLNKTLKTMEEKICWVTCPSIIIKGAFYTLESLLRPFTKVPRPNGAIKWIKGAFYTLESLLRAFTKVPKSQWGNQMKQQQPSLCTRRVGSGSILRMFLGI